MKIAFITHPYPNYVPDLLLHGLRKLLGPNVVDYPRKDCLYEGVLGLGVCPQNQLCPNWFPSDEGLIDRDDIAKKVTGGYFDWVVSDVRGLEKLRQYSINPKCKVVIIDGEDKPFPVPPGPYIICRRETDGSDFSIPLPMGFPEELLNWITSYDHLPKKFSIGFLGSTQEGKRRQIAETIASHFPDALLQATAVPSSADPNPVGRLGRDDYYRHLQQCRMVLSLAGAGYDTFRFWENAACNAVHIAARMPLHIPNDFIDGTHIIRFSQTDQFKQLVDNYLGNEQAANSIIREGRYHLIQHHLTTQRARFFLDQIIRAFENGAIFLDQTASKPARVDSPLDHIGENPKGETAVFPIRSDCTFDKSVRSENSPAIERANLRIPILIDQETLFLGLVTGKNYGWGVCSRYLIRELSRLVSCHVLNSDDGSDGNPALGGKLFQAITGIDLFPMFEKARGRQNYGYTFFENELTRLSVENAKKYDLVLAGSSWCRDRLLERDITNCDVLIQGIDPQLYYPIHSPRSGNDFVIFSGGKFELRKGQDLVLKAVKILQDKYDDIVLVNCWYNIWPESMKWMAHSRHIEFEYKECSWHDLMQSVYQANGMDCTRIKTFELVPNEMQRPLYEQTDLGVFPNRCEGGTNLVMMEYMACGKPVVASNTSGHTDIVSSANALLLNDLAAFNIAGPENKLIARWQEPSLDELVAQIEYAYLHRSEVRQIGIRAGQDMKRYTWKHTASNLLRVLFPNRNVDDPVARLQRPQ